MNTEHESIYSLISGKARTHRGVPAILSSRRPALSYGQLLHQVETVVRTIRALGVEKGDRVAVVLPNGPEMATTILGVLSGATCAPLNPAYHAEDFRFYLTDLQAKAVIVSKGSASPAIDVAASLGVRVIELSASPNDPSGVFTLSVDSHGNNGIRFSSENDTALVLHTSGTTSRPKIVPLTHRNLLASANNVAHTLCLRDQDRCLNIMPLFHIHGIVAALLSSLYAGGSVFCASGFDGDSFFKHAEEYRPTWYTAVPTMHQEIVRRAPAYGDVVRRSPLRFIRSSSSALPVKVIEELETTFSTPVIEAYGMTEAAHQMASNPLPPKIRKPGSVGIAAGPDVAIMNDAGDLLPTGSLGEIVIRGENVTQGYENNPGANAAGFRNGWCRTGDQGYFDQDGYLTLTGRLKELINRGGEKIAPREIDEVLMEHPAILQAVAFAVPHPTLGEGIAAAVVLREGVNASELDIRGHALRRLPDFKVPDRIVFLKDLPKGPTGKVQRTGLADRLASELAVVYEAPVAGLEQLSALIFARVLNCPPVGRNDNFFALGGDSVGAMQVVARLSQALALELPPTILFHCPTAASLSDELMRLQDQQELASLAAELQKLSREEAALLLEKAFGDRK